MHEDTSTPCQEGPLDVGPRLDVDPDVGVGEGTLSVQRGCHSERVEAQKTNCNAKIETILICEVLTVN